MTTATAEATAEGATEPVASPKAKPLYFVWRPDARTQFRAYRVRPRSRPLPGDHNLIGSWPSLTEARRVQKAANRWARGNKTDDPKQQILFPGFIATYAETSPETS